MASSLQDAFNHTWFGRGGLQNDSLKWELNGYGVLAITICLIRCDSVAERLGNGLQNRQW